ncbi:hypothetical protein HDV02_003361, partial [Globomyces sp. JEL0801]
MPLIYILKLGDGNILNPIKVGKKVGILIEKGAFTEGYEPSYSKSIENVVNGNEYSYSLVDNKGQELKKTYKYYQLEKIEASDVFTNEPAVERERPMSNKERRNKRELEELERILELKNKRRKIFQGTYFLELSTIRQELACIFGTTTRAIEEMEYDWLNSPMKQGQSLKINYWHWKRSSNQLFTNLFTLLWSELFSFPNLHKVKQKLNTNCQVALFTSLDKEPIKPWLKIKEPIKTEFKNNSGESPLLVKIIPATQDQFPAKTIYIRDTDDDGELKDEYVKVSVKNKEDLRDIYKTGKGLIHLDDPKNLIVSFEEIGDGK